MYDRVERVHTYFVKKEKRKRKKEKNASHVEPSEYTNVSGRQGPCARGFTESIEAADAPAQSPLMATTLAERANAHLRRKDYDASLADCARAIASQEDHKPAYFTQATALLNLGRPQEAADALGSLLRMDPADETVRRHHEKALFEVRKANRPDYYGILGISSVATLPEIKQAYKARCMEWHPDRHAMKSDEEKATAEMNFKALGEALEIMEDQMKRQLYDEGYDKEAGLVSFKTTN